MQPKVSMVIPCYNKEKWIGNTFDSIMAQKWDNIELILINDGSTDGTRRIIAEYEPKFLARGFEVVIIEQQNQGVAAATRNGLMRITGDFVCQIDADDELDAEYISTMAGWLLENPDYDWVVCDMLYVYQSHTIYRGYFTCKGHEQLILSNIAEGFLLSKFVDTVHEYMVRTDYLKKSGLVQNYFYDMRRTQEPQYVIPLAVAGGKLKHIAKPLYRYIQNESMISRRQDYEDYDKYYDQYYLIVQNTIERLDAEPRIKNRLLIISEIMKYKRMFSHAEQFNSYERIKRDKLDEKVINLINSVFYPSPGYTREWLQANKYFFAAVEDSILSIQPEQLAIDGKRIIAWGALGKRGGEILPCLRGTILEPDELWDETGNGVEIKKPDVGAINKNDIVLAVPYYFHFEMLARLKEIGCTILLYDDIIRYIAGIQFPRFYDGSVKFTSEGFRLCNQKSAW